MNSQPNQSDLRIKAKMEYYKNQLLKQMASEGIEYDETTNGVMSKPDTGPQQLSLI